MVHQTLSWLALAACERLAAKASPNYMKSPRYRRLGSMLVPGCHASGINEIVRSRSSAQLYAGVQAFGRLAICWWCMSRIGTLRRHCTAQPPVKVRNCLETSPESAQVGEPVRPDGSTTEMSSSDTMLEQLKAGCCERALLEEGIEDLIGRMFWKMLHAQVG